MSNFDEKFFYYIGEYLEMSMLELKSAMNNLTCTALALKKVVVFYKLYCKQYDNFLKDVELRLSFRRDVKGQVFPEFSYTEILKTKSAKKLIKALVFFHVYQHGHYADDNAQPYRNARYCFSRWSEKSEERLLENLNLDQALQLAESIDLGKIEDDMRAKINSGECFELNLNQL